jgi:fucose 4-O-acetylase-like acetyltransferase
MNAASTRTAPHSPAAQSPAGAHNPAAQTAGELAAATPASRDRYVDFLRVLSIGVVVLGHWLMATVEVRPGGIRVGNALAGSPTAQLLTWVFQVMPVFFFVGGFAHATGMRSLDDRGGGYADFVRARVARLLRPTAVFLAVWTGLAIALELTGHQDGIGAVASRTIVQPLWFMGVYLGVVALAPPMYRLHRRYGAAVVVALLAAAALVDAVRFGAGVPAAGSLNLAFVWLAAHQFGYLYADGTLTRRIGVALAAGGLTAVVLLTVVSGAYPVSMVGMPGDRVSNMSPPTLALAAHTGWLIGLVLILRAPVTRWLDRRRVWMVVVSANGVVMTTFLWHLTALFAAYAVLLGAGFAPPAAGSAGWWWSRPLWIAALALLGTALVALFRWAERPRGPSRFGRHFRCYSTENVAQMRKGGWAEPRRVAVTGGGAAGAAMAMGAVSVGVLGVAMTGLDGLLAGRSITLIAVPMTAAAGLALAAGGWAVLAARKFR